MTPISTCCQAPTIMTEYGVCPTCNEHCTFSIECPNCEGDGCDECEDGLIEIEPS